jgi:hypothetical protein
MSTIARAALRAGGASRLLRPAVWSPRALLPGVGSRALTASKVSLPTVLGARAPAATRESARAAYALMRYVGLHAGCLNDLARHARSLPAARAGWW